MADAQWTRRCLNSPSLLDAPSDQHFSKAVLTVRKAGETPIDFMKWTMSDLLISSYQTAGAGEPDPIPTDQFSLNFRKIRVDFLVQSPTGTLAAPVSAEVELES